MGVGCWNAGGKSEQRDDWLTGWLDSSRKKRDNRYQCLPHVVR